MKLYTEIEKRIDCIKEHDKEQGDRYIQFWSVVRKVIRDNEYHLTQVTAQLSNYDIHDSAHCDKVLENMEALLGDKMQSLSFFELVLLYLSAKLHDSAMALPKWEYQLLSAVEGTTEVFDRKNLIQINNDLQPPQTVKEVIAFIKNHKKEIYGDFETVKLFVFSIQEEWEFQKDLAKRILDYENFRNEHASELRGRLGSAAEYLNYSEVLRVEYIRSKHHTRVVDYIRTLQDMLADSLGSVTASQVISCLSSICRSHGEDESYVFSLKCDGRIEDEFVNVQFLSILLRLADVIHFSADRAPLSLYAEKRITDFTSLKHWKAKFQELRYKIIRKNAMTEIQFTAFCEEPQIYYFIQHYIDWIDDELTYYHKHLRQLQQVRLPDMEKYDLSLEIRVDRSGICSNPKKFIPEHDLKFTLEQKKIIELLMGVQLYKDKYLCLRELYQNSLDACRCMQAENASGGVTEEFYIRFGLGMKKIDGVEHKYLYCLDNGTGMTKEIVKNHLLKIGNSYYKSKSFDRQNTNWNNAVNPTSQFGIGILSCYMIADKIEITTLHYDSEDGIFSLNIDGISENAYYMKPDEIESEMIGRHGTLVKLFLKTETAAELNNDIPEKLPYVIHVENIDHLNDNVRFICDGFYHSLFYLINSQVGLVPKGIKVEVVLSDEQNIEIIPWNKIFDFRDYPDLTPEEIQNVMYNNYDGSDGNFFSDVAANEVQIRNIENIPITVANENIELYTFVRLSRSNEIDYQLFSLYRTIWDNEDAVFVDGIYAEDYGSKMELYDRMKDNFLINYIGKEKPVLSVDRSMIVSYSETLEQQLEELAQEFIQALVDTMLLYWKENHLSFDALEVKQSLEMVLYQFSELSAEFIYALAQTEAKNITLSNIVCFTDSHSMVGSLVNSSKLTLHGLDLRKCGALEQLIILGKLISADFIAVDTYEVQLLSDGFFSVDSGKSKVSLSGWLEMSSIIIKADRWDGTYCEYDMVSNLWPVVSPDLFHCFDQIYIEKDSHSERYKDLSFLNDHLFKIAQLDPVRIYPQDKIFHTVEQVFSDGVPSASKDMLVSGYSLSEAVQYPYIKFGMEEDCVIFAFIAPRDLTEKEQKSLQEHEKDENYFKGVREGWSVLFFVETGKYYVKPGLATREEMYRWIPRSVRESAVLKYCDTAGKPIF